MLYILLSISWSSVIFFSFRAGRQEWRGEKMDLGIALVYIIPFACLCIGMYDAYYNVYRGAIVWGLLSALVTGLFVILLAVFYKAEVKAGAGSLSYTRTRRDNERRCASKAGPP